MQVTSYGEIAWVRISGYPKVAMKQGQEYSHVQAKSSMHPEDRSLILDLK